MFIEQVTFKQHVKREQRIQQKETSTWVDLVTGLKGQDMSGTKFL
jgi:hypothetical protein